ncbi:hypothetical protein KM1_075330 [Entamoeba histolytica HM-3:IMSS]|uniref:Uncharacterized protein n=1 Tax=Entamoeba histolytica HM-3:IMSS TaxID=885315 RepID=M7X3B7_ENTHI|nr:hypothetical protein KM1_075330 [Entamoeba histolytica HM-3:IMSS]
MSEDITTNEKNEVLFFQEEQPIESHRGWYKQLSVTILAGICLISNTFCIILLHKELKGHLWVLVVGIIEGIVFLGYSGIKFVLRLSFIQSCLKSNQIIKKICDIIYINYDNSSIIFKLPNIEKIIEKYCITIDVHNKENSSPINQLNHLFRLFCDKYEGYIKTFSLMLIICGFIIVVIEMFLYQQATVSFNIIYTQVLVYSVVCIINISLTLFFLWKVILMAIFFILQVSYGYIKGGFKEEIIISILLLSIITIPFCNSVVVLQQKSMACIWFLIMGSLIITILLFCTIEIGWYIYIFIHQKVSFSSFIFSELKKVKNHIISLLVLIFCIIIILVSFNLSLSNMFYKLKYTYNLSFLSSFDTVNTSYINEVISYCEFEKHISQLTFGIGDSSYLRQEYAQPSIKTPTINMSSLFDVSSTTQDYYRMTSSAIPMNGIVYYPTNIKTSNETKSVVIILGSEMGNLIDSDMGYIYLQESLAENGIVSVCLDQGFLDKDENGNSILPKNGMSVKEGYLNARVVLTIQTINYLFKRLNQFFGQKLNFENIGIIGDREGGGVAMRIINKLRIGEIDFIEKENLNQFSIESIFVLNCKDIPVENPMVGMNSYFIETLPELSPYDPPLLSSYNYFNKTDRDDNILFKYSGSLIIEKGIGDYFNMKYQQAQSDILVDYILKNNSYLLKENELRCLVNNYVISHFLCSMDNKCDNLPLLMDFKNGKSIIPIESGYYSTFESNKEILLYVNGTTFDISIESNSTYSGKLYQNMYQSLHQLYVCNSGMKCALKFVMNKPVNCSGIKFSFFKNNGIINKEEQDTSKIYEQSIKVTCLSNSTFTLPSFTYTKISEIENNGEICEMFFVQTYSFSFPLPNQVITSFTLYFTGEILLDDVALFY